MTSRPSDSSRSWARTVGGDDLTIDRRPYRFERTRVGAAGWPIRRTTTPRHLSRGAARDRLGGPPALRRRAARSSRPATAQRPTAAPFVAPVVAGKLVFRNAAPAPAAKTPTPAAPPSIPSADIDPTSHSTRPVTNEIVALDAIDAFDAMWGVSEPSGRRRRTGAGRFPARRVVVRQRDRRPAAVGGRHHGERYPGGGERRRGGTGHVRVERRCGASTTPAWLEDDVAHAGRADARPGRVRDHRRPRTMSRRCPPWCSQSRT